jgi:potassium-transporting ATPase KdpC subunit
MRNDERWVHQSALKEIVMKNSKSSNLSDIKSILVELRVSIIATLSLAILLCGIYPLMVWALAQGVFPQKANGSLITRSGKVLGSSLIAQSFSGPAYIHPRPSAAGDGYDAAASGGSNLGPTSQKLIDEVRGRVEQYRKENGLKESAPVPADAVTASASGLDPHISPKNANFQAHRVAQARGISEEAVRSKIKAHTEGHVLGFLGERRVNVLELNLDLDKEQ